MDENKTLILVRTNGQSSAIRWLEDRNIQNQFCVRYSYYGDELSKQNVDHYYSGGKWSGIFDFFEANKVLNEFEYFWFLDDDIESTPENALLFQRTAIEHGFKLAQPALLPDSFFAHSITLANPQFKFRRTNFVELMMPWMHRSVLTRVLPLFKDRHAALGLDLFWHQLTDDPTNDVAIVDEAPMGHYRPRRKHLRTNLNKQAINMFSEKKETIETFKVKRQLAVVLSAVSKDGTYLIRGPKLWRALLRGFFHEDNRKHSSGRALYSTAFSLFFQMMARTDARCFDQAAYEQFIEHSS
ncbi:hypothetical protein [Roseibium sp. MMSF_3544]|uniref:hypothetical protein n=1 Tax=unclassified Roseibium TaxID=2629323 RepID=UPI00273E7BF6|nr:hypothetical protein [Roseibium sp. MMSF_3544]